MTATRTASAAALTITPMKYAPVPDGKYGEGGNLSTPETPACRHMSRSKNLNFSPPSKSRIIQVCLFLVRLFLLGVVTLILLIGVAWAFGALWFDFPFSPLRRPLAAAFGLGTIGALAFVRP